MDPLRELLTYLMGGQVGSRTPVGDTRGEEIQQQAFLQEMRQLPPAAPMAPAPPPPEIAEELQQRALLEEMRQLHPLQAPPAPPLGVGVQGPNAVESLLLLNTGVRGTTASGEQATPKPMPPAAEPTARVVPPNADPNMRPNLAEELLFLQRGGRQPIQQDPNALARMVQAMIARELLNRQLEAAAGEPEDE